MINECDDNTDLSERSGLQRLIVFVPGDSWLWFAVGVTAQSDSRVRWFHVHNRHLVHVSLPHWTVFYSQTNRSLAHLIRIDLSLGYNVYELRSLLQINSTKKN